MPPDALDRFLSALRKTGRRRLTLDSVRHDFALACPELAEQADRRDHLARLIQSAAMSGALNLPRSTIAWDRAGASALPRFIVLNTARVQRPLPIPGYAWHPLLAFAAHETNERRRTTLRRVNEWLKTDPDLTYTVPIKERSLEIFGDEKRLDQLRSSVTHLFTGQLALPALGCRICPIPLPYEDGPPETRGHPILIIENNDTWASFCTWNRTARRFAAIAYAGGGNAKGISYDELFIDSLLERCGSSALYYFGDIDPRGLRIGAGAAQRRAERHAVPLMPAVTLYNWLLAHGVRRPVETEETMTPDDVAWLPVQLHTPIDDLFAARKRIPQESLGTRILRQWDVAHDGAIPG